MSNKLRVVFEKGEAMRYTGHLDILRTFIRGLRRAEIPVKYSEGFSPHAIMTFALPMGVGVTSECEIMDVTLKEQMNTDLFISRVNENMQPGGIKIVSAQFTDKAMPNITKAEYIIDIINDGVLNIEDIKNVLIQKEIIVDKKSKKQVKAVNIMEHIFESEILDFDENNLKLRLVISAGNTFNIKSVVVVSGLASVSPSLNPIVIKPHRTKFFFE